MKVKHLIITFFTIILNPFHSFSQYDLTSGATFATPKSMYVGNNVEGINRTNDALKAAYYNNKKYRDLLIDWVFDLMKKGDDEFVKNLEVYYWKLKVMDRFESKLDELDEINYKIKTP
jgi:hypothetical protein